MFSDGMKKRREALGISQQTLSKISGVPQSTISAVESGARIPKEDTMVMIANGLNCTVGELLGEDEKKLTVKDDELDMRILTLARNLSPADMQRVEDFVSGIVAARKGPPSP